MQFLVFFIGKILSHPKMQIDIKQKKDINNLVVKSLKNINSKLR